MIKPFTYFFIFFSAFFLKAQENLVPNPSFEEYSTCPLGLADLTVLDWYAPTGGSSDYYNSCNLDVVSVPSNILGYQFAHTGNGYCGFGNVFGFPNGNQREYIQIQLLNNLESGKNYLFKGFFNLADSSRYCIKNLGIVISTNAIGGAFGTAILYNQVLTFPQNISINDVNQWVEINISFTANGGEKFLTIGLFNEDSSSIINEVNPLNNDFSYYYVDDVSITEVKFDEIPNFFSPNNDNDNDEWIAFVPEVTEFSIINRWGEVIIKGKSKGNLITWNGKSSNGNECSEGVYFYKIDHLQEVKTGFIQLMR
ncbi:MAG: gliding motility-associated C-terminal domain-containing protein [Fluviicola sp.]